MCHCNIWQDLQSLRVGDGRGEFYPQESLRELRDGERHANNHGDGKVGRDIEADAGELMFRKTSEADQI